MPKTEGFKSVFGRFAERAEQAYETIKGKPVKLGYEASLIDEKLVLALMNTDQIRQFTEGRWVSEVQRNRRSTIGPTSFVG